MFDSHIERGPTHAYKWEKYKGKDILPCWVADAEYACPPEIISGLKSYLDHQILGYTLPSQYAPANHAVVSWLSAQYDWQIEPEWIVWTPGVVPGFNAACKGLCRPGDKVIVQMPNYPPLLAAPAINGMERLAVPTVVDNGRETIDLASLESLASDPKCHLMILCNPMNPNGSVLTSTELTQISEICQRYQVILCSDEIHCDLILDPTFKHIPAGKVVGLEDNSITLMAASKTFNVAGLGTSFAVIPDEKLRARFVRGTQGLVPWANILGLVATEIAFSQCQDWHQALLTHLRENRDYLAKAVEGIPGLDYQVSPATFLAWIDASGLGLQNPQSWFEDKGIGPSPGADFGSPQHVRINFASSRAYLEQIVTRLQR